MEQYHGTTILSVRRGSSVAMGGDEHRREQRHDQPSLFGEWKIPRRRENCVKCIRGGLNGSNSG